MKRGGARPGAGRKSKPNALETVGFRADPEQHALILKVAESQGKTVSEFVRDTVLYWLTSQTEVAKRLRISGVCRCAHAREMHGQAGCERCSCFDA